MSSSIAIITARGGSKRIPRKNIKIFCGKPIIAYSIETAFKSGLFDEVMVSTEDIEIAEIAKSYNASVPFLRSTEMANDYATTVDVILEVILQYEGLGRTFDNFCCMYPTAPFLTAEKLQESYKLLQPDTVSCVIPVVKFSYPPQRGLVLSNGRLSPFQPEAIDFRSQDLEPVFHDSGQFYWAKVKPFLKVPNFFSNQSVPFILSELEVQDIDTETDWVIAEKNILVTCRSQCNLTKEKRLISVAIFVYTNISAFYVKKKTST